MPSRKRSLPATEVVAHHFLDSTANETNFEAEAVNPTTLVIRRAVRPVDPPPSGPLVIKRRQTISEIVLGAPRP